MSSKPTAPETFLHEQNGGVLAEKLGHILSDVAAAVVDHGKAGTITLTMSLKQMGENHMVNVASKLAYSRPTKRGKTTEEDTTETPMHVGAGGRMTLFPEDQVTAGQMHMYKGKTSEPMPNT